MRRNWAKIMMGWEMKTKGIQLLDDPDYVTVLKPGKKIFYVSSLHIFSIYLVNCGVKKVSPFYLLTEIKEYITLAEIEENNCVISVRTKNFV